MRTPMLLVLVAASATGACKWTEFDDLAGETWVVSTEKPNVPSKNYGVAIQRGARPGGAGSGGTLVVVGADPPTYSELAYSAQGDATLASPALNLNTQYQIDSPGTQPVLLADPTSDDIALVVSRGSEIIALIGNDQLSLNTLSGTTTTLDAATYMVPPPGTSPAERPLVASGEVVVGAQAAPPASPPCRLVDGPSAIKPLALGAVRNTGMLFDDVVAWGANGTLYRYPGSVFNGCAPANSMSTAVSHATGFLPGHGSQILSIDATHILLQGHHDADDASLLQVYDASVPNMLTPVGGSVSTVKLRTAAILDAGADKYVVAGYPAAVVDGKTAGEVVLYKVSAAGIDPQSAARLHDAQPEDNKSFGRAVAAMPFNGTPIIAVAADNEIFMYFRANLTSGSMLYNETRQGR